MKFQINIGIVISIVLSIFIYILYSYFNKGNYESFISSIKGARSKIIVSLTTSPKRIDKIKPVIDSILHQTVKVDAIWLNLPHIFKRNNTKFGNIPSFITSNPIIHVNFTEDIGPATKIIPTAINFNKETDCIIISIDDDVWYHPKFIETFLSYNKDYPNTVITGTSFIKDPTSRISTRKNIYFSQLLEGFSGVLYHSSFFNNFNTKYITDSPKECYLADDLMLSNYLLSNKIKILCINTQHLVKSLSYGFNDDALHYTTPDTALNPFDTKNVQNYRSCISWLKSKNDLHIINPQKNNRQPNFILEL